MIAMMIVMMMIAMIAMMIVMMMIAMREREGRAREGMSE
jgi:uncharacterized membrane protein